MTTSRDDSQAVLRAMASDCAGQPTFADCRNAARAVHEADVEKEALNSVRPRGVSGLFRARAPVALQLRLAAQQGRLLWWSAQTFALLEPPSNNPARGGSPWLRWLDRWWDPLLFAVPSVILLGAAALLALPQGAAHWRVITALVSVLTVLGYVAVLVTAVAVRGFVSLYRTLILGRSKDVTESGIGQVLASRWSIALYQLPETNTDSVTRATVDAVQHWVANQVAASSDGRHESVDLLCPEHGVTSAKGRAALRRDPRVSLFTQDPPALLIRSDPTIPLVLSTAPAKVTGRLLLAIPWLVGGMAIVLAILAQFVARWESEDCAQKPHPSQLAGCADQPRTYGDALYWLLNRLSGGDPEGLGVHTAQARSVGLLVTLMSVIVVGGVITSLVQQAVERTQRFGQDVTDAYNETLFSVGAPAGVIASPIDPVPPARAPLQVIPTTGGVPAPPPTQCSRRVPTFASFAAGLALGLVLAIRRRRS
jgi:hypothetical protein